MQWWPILDISTLQATVILQSCEILSCHSTTRNNFVKILPARVLLNCKLQSCNVHHVHKTLAIDHLPTSYFFHGFVRNKPIHVADHYLDAAPSSRSFLSSFCSRARSLRARMVLSEYRKGLSAELSGSTKMAIAMLTSP